MRSLRSIPNFVCFAGLAFVSAAICSPSARADDRDKRITAVRVERGPLIDGRLDDPAWRAARADSRFTQNFPDEGKAPSQKTDLYVIYDDRALYVGVRCHDREPGKIIERLTRRDRDTDGDKISIDIDSRGDHASAYHFEVNVSGVLTDALRFNDTDYNPDWDGLWNAVTTRDDEGWTAEFEIPWRTLRFAGGEPEMGFEVRRNLPRRQETDEWAYIPRTESAQVSRYGKLLGVRGLGPARLLQIQPYLATGITLRSNSTAGGGRGSDDGAFIVPNGGGDLKLGLTSNLTLDATINPDFGQVEADQVVLNLTTYEIFYPEKRPFFLEGVDLLSTPIRQFYTRRIGRQPPDPALGRGEVITDKPLAGRIWGATKVSGQILPHLSIAALDALTSAENVSVLRPGATVPEPRLVAPLANYGVLRLRSDFAQSYVGVMMTAVNRFERPYAATPDPLNDRCPGGSGEALGRCTHDAYTAGADFKLVTHDSAWGVRGQALWSRIEGGPSRTVADGTRIGPGDNGLGLWLEGGKQGGEHFLFGARYEGYSPTLDLNDAGYLRRQNVHFAVASARLRSTKPVGITLEFDWETFGFYKWSWTGVTLDRAVGSSIWVRWKNFWQSWSGVGYVFSRFDNRETENPGGTRDGALTERPRTYWVEQWIKSDTRKPLVGETNLHLDRTQHGLNLQGDVTLSYRPVPQLELSFIPRFVYSFGDLRYAYLTEAIPVVPADGAPGNRYWFGDLQSESFDVTFRGIYTFSPRLTLQTYAQVFVAAAHYANFVVNDAALRTCPAGQNPCPPALLSLSRFNAAPSSLGTSQDFREGAINLNVVLRWEYLPGSTVIAVYSRSQAQPTYDPMMDGMGSPSLRAFRGGPAVDSFLVKLSWLWR